MLWKISIPFCAFSSDIRFCLNIAEKALPISQGIEPGAINVWPEAIAMIFSRSDSPTITAIKALVSITMSISVSHHNGTTEVIRSGMTAYFWRIGFFLSVYCNKFQYSLNFIWLHNFIATKSFVKQIRVLGSGTVRVKDLTVQNRLDQVWSVSGK